MSKVPLLELPDGAQSPQLAFGVFQIPPKKQPMRSRPRCRSATGIDTAGGTRTNAVSGRASATPVSTGPSCTSSAGSTTVVTVLTMHDVHSMTR